MPPPSEILVVDDDAAVYAFMQRVLEGRGYRVWTAPNPAEALNVLANHGNGLRLLLTDVLMPEMSGLALAEVAHESVPGLAVLYDSGYLGVYEHRLSEAVCLDKPFTASQLLQRVQALAPAM